MGSLSRFRALQHRAQPGEFVLTVADSVQRLHKLTIIDIVDACVCDRHGAIFRVKVSGDAQDLVWVDESVIVLKASEKLFDAYLASLTPPSLPTPPEPAKRKDPCSFRSLSPSPHREKEEAKEELDTAPDVPLTLTVLDSLERDQCPLIALMFPPAPHQFPWKKDAPLVRHRARLSVARILCCLSKASLVRRRDASRRDVPSKIWLRAAAAFVYLEEQVLLSWIFSSEEQELLRTVFASRDLNFGPVCSNCHRHCVMQFVYEMHLRVCHGDRSEVPASGKVDLVPRPEVAASDYEVAEIRSRREKDGKVMYLLRWKNYASCAWVAAEDLNCPRLVRQFLDRGKKRKKKTAAPKKNSQQKKPSGRSKKLAADAEEDEEEDEEDAEGEEDEEEQEEEEYDDDIVAKGVKEKGDEVDEDESKDAE